MKINLREMTLSSYLEERTLVPDYEKSLFDFYYITGARVSEALTVRARDINFNDMSVRILTEKNPSDPFRCTHFFPFEGDAEILIKSIKKRVEDANSNDFLWKFENRKVPRYLIWDYSTKFFQTPVHSFRHTHAIQLSRDIGLNAPELQAEMGWKDFSSAQSYLKYQTNETINKKRGFTKKDDQF